MLRRSIAAAALAALTVPFLAPAATAAGPPTRTAAADPVVTAGLGYLATQQQTDGGFEVSQFPLFETPDAIFAEAAAAQTGPAWNATEAKSAIEALVTNGHNPLDYVDGRVDGEATPVTDADKIAVAARSAKLVALVAAPLGINPSDFDPSANSANPVDLWARINAVRNANGTFTMTGQLNGVLYAALAEAATGITVPAPLVAEIKAAQRGDGSWDYSGSVAPTGNDIDTTALALITLRRAGRTKADPAVAHGLKFLAEQQKATGAWQSFGSDDPNSTSMASMALTALTLDVSSRAWRDAAAPDRAGDAYVSPLIWLASQQASDGHITSPNDGFGINTFATTQTVQALTRVPYAGHEHDAFVAHLAAGLTTKWIGGVPGNPSAANLAVASDALGSNASVYANRLAAVTAVLGSDGYRRAVADELYQRSLGRTTDSAGATYWANQLKTMTRQQMMVALVSSAEFYNKAGQTAKGFVANAYKVILFGRTADSSGSAYWVGRLNSGTPRSQVARSLLASTEYRQKEVAAQFTRLLGRAPDTAARDRWTERLATERIEVLVSALTVSPEYYRRAVG